MAKNALELTLQGDVRKQGEQLQKAFLNTLGWKGIRKLEQFATVNAARALQRDVRDAAPDGPTGLMGKSVRGRRSRITRPGAIVGPVAGKKGAWYAWFVVKGVKPHSLKGGVAGKLGPKNHPGIPPNNFVIETVEANIQKATDAMAATIVLMLEDEAFRNMVVGLEVAYQGKKAAYWQSQKWGRHWKNADYMEGVASASSFTGKNRTEADWARLRKAASVQNIYKRRASGIMGVVPKMNGIR